MVWAVDGGIEGCIRRERKPGEGELGGAPADGSRYKTKEWVTCIGNASGSCQRNFAHSFSDLGTSLLPRSYFDVYN